jgi:hypothetical protein
MRLDLESGAQHFNGDPYYAGGHSTFLNNVTQVPRPDNGTYSNDIYTNIIWTSVPLTNTPPHWSSPEDIHQLFSSGKLGYVGRLKTQ